MFGSRRVDVRIYNLSMGRGNLNVGSVVEVSFTTHGSLPEFEKVLVVRRKQH